MQVLSWKTTERNESELLKKGHPTVTQSISVGTRKMVNYA